MGSERQPHAFQLATFHSQPSVSSDVGIGDLPLRGQPGKEFSANSPRQAWLTPDSQEPQSTLPLLHVTTRAQAEGKFLASWSTYWQGNRGCQLGSRVPEEWGKQNKALS